MSKQLIRSRRIRTRLRLNLRDTFSSLRHPNYRLWFYGQLVSLVGTWMQITAQGYLMFELTESPAYLGYAVFATGVPAWLFTLYGGLVADRVSRRTLLVTVQSFMMLLAFGLAGLTFAGLVQPWHIILFAFLLGVANAFDAPARQAFVLELVTREDLPNAIALNSSMINAGRAVGPAAAGLIYAWLGPAWCFTVNAVSFLAVIGALLMMRLKQALPRPPRQSALMDIKAGLTYVASHRVVRTIILGMVMVSLFGISYTTLIPAWAVKVLGGDATTNGWMQSGRGVGAMIGALATASMSRRSVRGRMLTIGGFLLPLALLIFSGIDVLWLSLLVLVAIGLGFMLFANNSNSLVQTHVPDELRGRVMGIFMLTFQGMMPIGGLLAGIAAEYIGEQLTVAFGAAILLLTALVIYQRVPELRGME